MNDHPNPFRREGLFRRAAPFTVAGFLGFAGEPLFGESGHVALLLPSLGLTAALVVAMLVIPWNRAPRWIAGYLPLVYLVAVALADRGEAGHTFDHDAMVLLPVIWIALYGTRRELGVVIAGVGATFVVPIAIEGALLHPDRVELSHGLLWVTLSLLIGATVHGLLREREYAVTQFNQAFEGAPIGMATADLTGVITRANRAYLELLGRSHEEIVGVSFAGFVHPDDLVIDVAAMASMESGETSTFQAENRLFHADGHEIYAIVNVTLVHSASGKPHHYFVQLQNVSDAKRAEQASRRLADIVESSDDAIFGCTPEGVVSSWNPGAERIFGYPAREMIGRPASLLAPPHRHDIGASILDGALDGEVLRGHETQWLTREGATVDLSMTVSPMRDPSDAIVGVSVIARDVTARKRARAEAEQVKEQFFSLVSHELRTPLASIIGYLEVLREGSAIQLTDEKRDEFLDVIHRNSQRLLRLVGDLLLVSKIQAGSFSITRYPVDLHELALQCVEAAAPVAAAERVGLTLAAEGGVEVEGDPDRLAQVLDNLVVNAVKYTPAGGGIEVRLSSSGDLACFEVVNSGPGIAENELGRLFEPFFRASNASNDVPGVGLGLVIVKSIVEAHGGQIAVESTPGVDTTFRVELPLRDPASDAQSQTKEAA